MVQHDSVETDTHDDSPEQLPHGKRAAVFASWLVDTYGAEYMNSGAGVLDVAGGKGMLSYELQLCGVRATVVDPNTRPLPKAIRGLLEADKLSEPFDQQFVLNHAELMQSISLVVAMHPDEATEMVTAHALPVQHNLNDCWLFAGGGHGGVGASAVRCDPLLRIC